MDLKTLSLPTLDEKKTRYQMESEDGWTVSVPEDKLEAYSRADHEAPLSRSEQRLLDRLRERLLSSKE